MKDKITKKDAKKLLMALEAGVVPRVGLRHIQVGRIKEVEAFSDDLEMVKDGGAAFRIVSGAYGSGKSFLLQLVRTYAMESSFAVMDADLSPERRLTGSKGQGLGTYRELLQHLSTNTQKEGGALDTILKKWIAKIQADCARQYGMESTDPKLVNLVSVRIMDSMSELNSMVYGHAFTKAIEAYWRGVKTQDEDLKSAVLKWIQAEYSTKTEAKKALDIDMIIDDQSWYDFLKLFAAFVVKAGYKGLVIFIDEGVNLYKIPNKQSRESNYEKLLTMFNDTMQGKAHNIGIVLSGTNEFVTDERRGLYSYEAIRSRLGSSGLTDPRIKSFRGPVIQLSKLTPNEIFLLLERLSMVHGVAYGYEPSVTDTQLQSFISSVSGRLGADKLLTPREVTRSFLDILNTLLDNPDLNFSDLIGEDKYKVKSAEKDPEQLDESEDIFANFDI